MSDSPTPPERAIIHRSSGDPHRTRALGPYVIEALVDRKEEGTGTVYRVRIAAGQTTSLSYHRVAEEYYYILAGSGTALLNGRAHSLQSGDFLRLPPGTTHGFTAGPDGLDMLDIHTPGCYPNHDTYFVDAKPEGFA